MLLNLNIMEHVYKKREEEFSRLTSTYRRLEEILISFNKNLEENGFNPVMEANYNTKDASVMITFNKSKMSKIIIECTITSPGILTIKCYKSKYSGGLFMEIYVMHVNNKSVEIFRRILENSRENKEMISMISNIVSETLDNLHTLVNKAPLSSRRNL